LLVKFDALPREDDGLVQPLVVRLDIEVEHTEYDGVGEPGISLGQRRIEFDGAVQQSLRLLIVLNGRLVEVLHPKMKEVPRTECLWRLPLRAQALGATDLGFDPCSNGLGDLVLDLGDVLDTPVVPLRPHVSADFRFDKPRPYSQVLTTSDDTPFHDVIGSEVDSDAANVDSGSLEREHGTFCDHEERPMLG
jgi:hypothetical protein